MLSGRNLVKVAFMALFSAMVLYLLVSFRTINYDSYLAAMGTMILAYYTAESAAENRRQTQRMMEDAQGERRRRHIQEQLERVYSPLLAYRNHISAIQGWDSLVFETFTQPFPETLKLTLNQVQMCYEYLALPETKPYMRELYGFFTHRRDVPSEFRDEFLRVVQEHHDGLVSKFNQINTLNAEG